MRLAVILVAAGTFSVVGVRRHPEVHASWPRPV